MKQNKFFILAAALAFVACSSDDNYTAKEKASQAPQEVSFSAYMNRSVTRAGAAGTLSTDGSAGNTGATGKVSLKTEGFGVFGYYTDNQYYSQTATPNFMYNEKVTYDTDAWKTQTMKYWPNEFGYTAESEGIDRLSFFAYAPYVEVNSKTGDVSGDKTSGIIGLTNNTKIGDPFVKYAVDFDPTKCVDLCWGVAAAEYSDVVVDGTADFTVEAGDLFIDLTKPKTGSKVNFNFLHALASLNVRIDADVNDKAHNQTNAVDDKTKIYVRSISFEGFATKGMLNLNSKTADWYDMTGLNKLNSDAVTVYDGRRNGMEGRSGAAANENPTGLNKIIVQSVPYDSADPAPTAGVTKDPVNLFEPGAGGSEATPIFVIPTNDNMRVTIVYDVETKDDNVAGFLSDGKTHGSTVENKITKDITYGDTPTNLKLEAGKIYTIKLHLGMTSVKFEAEVKAWETGQVAEPWLPINAE